MEFQLKTGMKGEKEDLVVDGNTARVYASGAVDVYATPAMIGLIENAAFNAVGRFLPDGWTTVGTNLEVKHLAATPIGMKVKAQAELVEIDGRRLVFKVEAYDEKETIGEGIHERFIVELERFLGKVNKKRNS